MNVEKIKIALINSCIKKDAKRFIPYLLVRNVKTTFPSKLRFYSFFKQMITYTKENSNGKLSLVIKKNHFTDSNDNYIDGYLFYDEVCKFPRLTVFVKEYENGICLDMPPF